MQAERRRVHEALQVGIEPARDAGVERGDEKDDDLGAGGIDAHGLGHQAAAEHLDGLGGPLLVDQDARQQEVHRGAAEVGAKASTVLSAKLP